MNLSFCQSCPDKAGCSYLGKDFKCPRAQGPEVPFSALSTVSNFVDLAKPSSEVFCSAEQLTCMYPAHHVMRQNLAKIATSTSLGVKEKAALTLLNSTSLPFSVLQISQAMGISERKIFYLQAKIKK